MAYDFQVTTNARGNLHNLIGDPDACPELYTTMIELRGTTKLLGRQSIHEEQSLGYQVPKGNKLLKLHLHVSPWRTQTYAPNAMVGTYKLDKSLTLKFLHNNKSYGEI